MNEVIIITILSVVAVSLISFIGIAGLSFKAKQLRNILIYIISFAAGALLGDAFLHLLPELTENGKFGIGASLAILGGILIFFVLEKVLNWQHCHMPQERGHVHSFAYTNLVGDGLHNFIDGMIIAASYLISIPVGIATTLAVILHEIPQEIGDFGILLHGGFSKGKALFLNFISAIFAVFGAIATLLLQKVSGEIIGFLISIAIGGFVYIAGSDLIPELHKETAPRRSLWQVLAFVLGICVMAALLLIE